MSVTTAQLGQQQRAQAAQAMERGSQAARSQRAEEAAVGREPDRARTAATAAVDGMFTLYEKTSRVVLGVKEAASAGTRVDVHA